MDYFFYQLIGSFILFYNKIDLNTGDPIKKQRGWILGIIGIAILSYPAYKLNLWILLVYHVGVITLYIYGYYMLMEKNKNLQKLYKILFQGLFSLITFGFCLYLYRQTFVIKNINEFQLFQSCTGLIGALFLAIDTRKSNIIGWSSNIGSHGFCIYVMMVKSMYIIVAFQAASAIVACFAIKKEIRKKQSST